MAAVTIKLSNDRDCRELVLRPSQIITIGRASKAEAKQLQAAGDNALFDCPVISRQHAELKLSPFKSFEEQISITDRGSMHGTLINGKRILPFVPFTLKNGDRIKLGDRVTRGSDTHDGVSIKFSRFDAEPKERFGRPSDATHIESTFSAPQDKSIAAITSAGSYRVPSPSNGESDAASELLGSEDGGQDDQSSAKTTPEQVTSLPGSQHLPIDLDMTFHTAPSVPSSTPASLLTTSANHQLHVQHRSSVDAQWNSTADGFINDTYDESIDVQGNAEDEDSCQDDDDVEDGEDKDYDGSEPCGSDDDSILDLDDLSDSDASDLSGHHDQLSDVSDGDVLDAAASKQSNEPHPHSEASTFPLGFTQPTPPAHISMLQTYKEAVSTGSHGTSRPLYDPVRGSLGNACVSSATQGLPDYTYGDFQASGRSQPSNFGVNESDSSRWDRQPPAKIYYTPAHALTRQQPAVFHSVSRYPGLAFNDSAPHTEGMAGNVMSAQIQTSMPSHTFSERTDLDQHVHTFPVATSVSETAIPTAKSGFSIPEIVDQSPAALPPSRMGAKKEPMAAVDSAGNTIGVKRKADAIARDDLVGGAAEWAELLETVRADEVEVQLAPPVVKRAKTMKMKTKSTRTNTMKVVGAEVAKFAAGAVVGSAGLMAFLCSPLAERLLS